MYLQWTALLMICIAILGLLKQSENLSNNLICVELIGLGIQTYAVATYSITQHPALQVLILTIMVITALIVFIAIAIALNLLSKNAHE